MRIFVWAKPDVGHIARVDEVSDILEGAGWEVVYGTSSATHEAMLKGRRPTQAVNQVPYEPYSDSPGARFYDYLTWLDEIADDLTDTFQQFDLVLCDATWPRAALSARRAGVPHVMLHTGLPTIYDPDAEPLNARGGRIAGDRESQWAQATNDNFAWLDGATRAQEAGLVRPGFLGRSAWDSVARELGLSLIWSEYPFPEIAESFELCCWPSALDVSTRRRANMHHCARFRPIEVGSPLRRKVVVSTGTHKADVYGERFERFHTAVREAARKLPAWSFVVQGEHTQGLPPNVQMLPWLDQVAELATAEVFVSHCGVNSTLEALARGIPIVAAPMAFDQYALAERVSEFGAGTFPQELDGQGLAEAIESASTLRPHVASLRAMLVESCRADCEQAVAWLRELASKPDSRSRTAG